MVVSQRHRFRILMSHFLSVFGPKNLGRQSPKAQERGFSWQHFLLKLQGLFNVRPKWLGFKAHLMTTCCVSRLESDWHKQLCRNLSLKFEKKHVAQTLSGQGLGEQLNSISQLQVSASDKPPVHELLWPSICQEKR